MIFGLLTALYEVVLSKVATVIIWIWNTNMPRSLAISTIGDMVSDSSSQDDGPAEIDAVPDLTADVQTLSNDIKACGGFADIFIGEWKVVAIGTNGEICEVAHRVAIKQLRPFSDDFDTINERLHREIDLMRKARHLNIAQVFGRSYHMHRQPAIIMPFYSNGNARNYVNSNPSVDKLKLISGIVGGLFHLHSLTPQLIHGDLKASNILVTVDGRAVIGDFGSSKTLGEAQNIRSTTSVRWQPPELFGEGMESTSTSDIWSLACTSCEIWVGHSTLPYNHRKRDAAVMHDILTGVKPFSQPEATTDKLDQALWELFGSCWSATANTRPSASDFMDRIKYLRLTATKPTGRNEGRAIRLSTEGQNRQIVTY